MRQDWRDLLERWRSAGLLDLPTVSRIKSYEESESTSARLEWPIVLALTLGGIALGAGLLLFVAANWDRLSPGTRLALVVLLVATFHIAGVASARDSNLFQSAFHAIGTIALGAGIALAGQIYHLPVDWPTGTLLWAIGALSAWLLLRDTAQLTLVAILVPVWLGAEGDQHFTNFWLKEWTSGALLLSLVYLGSTSQTLTSTNRTALVWIGGVTLLPLTIMAGFNWAHQPDRLALELLAFAPALALAWFLRGPEIWIPAGFAVWIAILTALTTRHSFLVQLWCALGSVALVAWGWRDGRPERINLGVAAFAMSVLFFYVSNVLDKIGRSASLIVLGVLLLAGGWALEQARRRLVATL